MSNENKSLDLLGIKGLSDSVMIATERCLDGAAAFLSRVCLPALEEFGLALRDRVSAWRARNAAIILSTANDIINATQPETQEKIHPRLVIMAIEEGSWIDDEVVQRMWAGLLVSSTSPEGKSDENLIFFNILKQLSSLQVRILSFAVERAFKFEGLFHLPGVEELIITVEELGLISKCGDLQRLDRELDHLRELGLIGFIGISGGINLETGDIDLTPTPLALHLYVRAQGSKITPVDYWKLQPQKS